MPPAIREYTPMVPVLRKLDTMRRATRLTGHATEMDLLKKWAIKVLADRLLTGLGMESTASGKKKALALYKPAVEVLWEQYSMMAHGPKARFSKRFVPAPARIS